MFDAVGAKVAYEQTREHMERHRDEKYAGLEQTTLSESQIYELIGYRMRLRDLSANDSLPPAPSFV